MQFNDGETKTILYVSMAYIVSIDIGMNNVPYNKSF